MNAHNAVNHLISLDKKNSVAKGFINIVHGPQSYPESIRVSEEVRMSLFLKERDDLYDRCIKLLSLYDIDANTQCNDLTHESKILLDIIISAEISPSILYLNNVIDSLSSVVKSTISDYLYDKTYSEGLTVIIASDSNDYKNTYLGRELQFATEHNS